MKAETFTPNPHGDEEKGWALIPVCWALVLGALVSTILRVYIRARLTRNLGWDDTVMVVTMVSTAFPFAHDLAEFDCSAQPSWALDWLLAKS